MQSQLTAVIKCRTPSLDVFSESTHQTDGNSVIQDRVPVTSFRNAADNGFQGLPERIDELPMDNGVSFKIQMLDTINKMLDIQDCFAVESVGLLILQKCTPEQRARFQGGMHHYTPSSNPSHI